MADRMPVEVVTRIFTHPSRTFTVAELLSFSLVSRVWRTAALDSPGYWQRVSIGSVSGYDGLQRVVIPEGNRRLALAQLAHKPFAPSKLWLVGTPAHTDFLSSVLRSNIFRLTRLHLTVPLDDALIAALGGSDAAWLEELEIRTGYADLPGAPSLALPVHVFNGTAPRLKVVELCGVGLGGRSASGTLSDESSTSGHKEEFPAFASVRKLDWEPGYIPALDISVAFPALEVLCLRMDFDPDDFDPSLHYPSGSHSLGQPPSIVSLHRLDLVSRTGYDPGQFVPDSSPLRLLANWWPLACIREILVCSADSDIVADLVSNMQPPFHLRFDRCDSHSLEDPGLNACIGIQSLRDGALRMFDFPYEYRQEFMDALFGCLPLERVPELSLCADNCLFVPEMAPVLPALRTLRIEVPTWDGLLDFWLPPRDIVEHFHPDHPRRDYDRWELEEDEAGDYLLPALMNKLRCPALDTVVLYHPRPSNSTYVRSVEAQLVKRLISEMVEGPSSGGVTLRLEHVELEEWDGVELEGFSKVVTAT
ncbi:hypothetical protein EXIGLDRAFT_828829 [Exidia glandulosa HHB12029]|uniref:F-box domain-containing protein n=1 Tax=Exidia glandulosa HHB12029 TaxID=1314781 RepID=A0A165Q4U4_EXIGL|nr:hypothetical protein EXIGLDRAFT_828829 [Exidia glandulosa HHB12029]